MLRESETFEGLGMALIRVARFDGLASPEVNILYRKSVNVFSRETERLGVSRARRKANGSLLVLRKRDRAKEEG